MKYVLRIYKGDNFWFRGKIFKTLKHVSTKLKSTLKKESWSCWIREDLALPNLLFAWQLEYMSVKRIKKNLYFYKKFRFLLLYMQSTCNLKLGSELLLEGEDT